MHLSEEVLYPSKGYFHENPCKTSNEFLLILADGRVLPCCKSSYILGSIKKNSILDIWYSKKMNDFRISSSKMHVTKKELPKSHCFNCIHSTENDLSNYYLNRYNENLKELKFE